MFLFLIHLQVFFGIMCLRVRGGFVNLPNLSKQCFKLNTNVSKRPLQACNMSPAQTNRLITLFVNSSCLLQILRWVRIASAAPLCPTHGEQRRAAPLLGQNIRGGGQPPQLTHEYQKRALSTSSVIGHITKHTSLSRAR